MRDVNFFVIATVLFLFISGMGFFVGQASKQVSYSKYSNCVKDGILTHEECKDLFWE